MKSRGIPETRCLSGTKLTRSSVNAACDECWVRDGGFVFRPAGDAQVHHNVVKFEWEMVPRTGGPPEACGLDIMVLTPDDRIRALYQFAR